MEATQIGPTCTCMLVISSILNSIHTTQSQTNYSWDTEGCAHTDVPGDYEFDTTVTLWSSAGSGHCKLFLTSDTNYTSAYEIRMHFYNNGSSHPSGESYGKIGFVFNVQEVDTYDFIFISLYAGESCLRTGYSLGGTVSFGSDAACPKRPQGGQAVKASLRVSGALARLALNDEEVVTFTTHFPPSPTGGPLVANGDANVVMFTNVYIKDMSTMSCPMNWAHNQGSIACYEVIHDWVSHAYATQYCTNSSTHLLVVNDEQEQDFLDQYLFYNYEDHWLGGIDPEMDGSFAWHSDTNVTMENWYTGSTIDTVTECAFLIKNIYWEGYYLNRFLWSAHNCSNDKHFICEAPALQCPPVPAVRGAVPAPVDVSLGSHVVYTCQVGHQFEPGVRVRSIVCFDNQTWSAISGDCQPVSCPPLNSTLAGTTLDTHGREYMASVRVTCERGHMYPDGNVTRTVWCTEDQSWSSQLPDCQRIHCPPAPRAISNTVIDGNGTGYLSAVTVRCPRGYMFPDNTVHRVHSCTELATWNDTWPGCIPLLCPAFEQENVTTDVTARTVDTVVTVTCARGHLFPQPDNDTEKVVECLDTAQWNTSFPDCGPVYCDPVDPYFEVDVNRTEPYPYQARLTVRCRDGDEFSDTSAELGVVCELKGTWIPLPLTCTGVLDVAAFKNKKPQEAPGAVIIGTTGVAFIIAFGVLLFVLDFNNLVKQIFHLKKNVKYFFKRMKRKLGLSENAVSGP